MIFKKLNHMTIHKLSTNRYHTLCEIVNFQQTKKGHFVSSHYNLYKAKLSDSLLYYEDNQFFQINQTLQTPNSVYLPILFNPNFNLFIAGHMKSSLMIYQYAININKKAPKNINDHVVAYYLQKPLKYTTSIQSTYISTIANYFMAKTYERNCIINYCTPEEIMKVFLIK